MQNPLKEIKEVVNLICAAGTADVQKDAVLRYYAPDASFVHPLCAVKPGPGSRDVILGVLQWYRVLSPHLEIEVKNATYNESTRELFVEVVQVFHIRLSPLPPVPSRLMVHLVLKPSAENNKLYQIAIHEDFYHPTDIVALVIPPLIPIVSGLQKLGTIASVVNARVAGLLGFWSVKSRGNGNSTAQADGNVNHHASGSASGSRTYAGVTANGGKSKSD